MADDIAHLAGHDSLTGLVNRRRLREVAHDLARTRKGAMALLYLDLDGFKGVNDRFGHRAGDALLREVAHRLARATHDPGIVARLGGDEFAVLLTGDAHVGERAAALGHHLIRSLSRVFALDGTSVRIGTSIGLATMPAGAEFDALLEDADAALYRAKKAGRGRLVIASTNAPADRSVA